MLKINQPLKISSKQYYDNRGSFVKFYSDFGLEAKEIFYTESKINTIRGMHFQSPPFEQNKIVHVVKGEIIDVLLDIRLNSNTYGKFFVYNIKEGGDSIFVPKGFAHGFLSKLENTIVIYLVDSEHNKEHDIGIKYDSFGYDWEVKDPIISVRDQNHQKFEDYKSPFFI